MKKHSVVSALLAVGMLAGSFASAAVLADDQT